MTIEEKLSSLQKRIGELHKEIAKRDMVIEELENELKVKTDIIKKQTVINAVSFTDEPLARCTSCDTVMLESAVIELNNGSERCPFCDAENTLTDVFNGLKGARKC